MHWSFTRVSSCSDFTGKLLVIWTRGDHLWKVKLFTRGCQVGLCFSGICNSVVGFVAFCTRLGSIRGCGSLRVSLEAGFVSSRNALSKRLRGRLLRAQQIYKPTASGSLRSRFTRNYEKCSIDKSWTKYNFPSLLCIHIYSSLIHFWFICLFQDPANRKKKFSNIKSIDITAHCSVIILFGLIHQIFAVPHTKLLTWRDVGGMGENWQDKLWGLWTVTDIIVPFSSCNHPTC